MRYRLLLAATLILLSSSLFGQWNRGDVVIETHGLLTATIPTDTYSLWVYQPGLGHEYATATAFDLIYKIPPLDHHPGHFVAPAADLYAFHHDGTVSLWNGVLVRNDAPGPGWTDLFTRNTELGEIAPMRNARFLVPERFADPAQGAKLIEFDAHGIITEYAFPLRLDVTGQHAVGAQHIELLANQCTLLYTDGLDSTMSNRVHAFDLCTRQSRPDFAILEPDQYAGAIRQLPNGDVLVADGNAILQFSGQGALLRAYDVSGVTRIALSTDGSTFWTLDVDGGKGFLRQFDPQHPAVVPPALPLGNPQSSTIIETVDADDLVIIGEWRASMVAAPTVRKSRAARH